MRSGRAAAAVVAVLGLGCGHAPAAPPSAGEQRPPAPPPPPDPRVAAAAVTGELRALLRSEAEAAWQRWTTGAAAPAAVPPAQAEARAKLFSGGALEALAKARAAATEPLEQRALGLAWATLAARALAVAAGDAQLALERARAQLVFTAPGDPKPAAGEPRVERSERDLDRLLSDEASDQKRHAIGEAEAQAAAALQPLALARDAAEAKARAALGLGGWAESIEAAHGRTPAQLAALAEQLLAATDALADRALATISQLNLGLPPDKLHRADLMRLVRAGGADAALPPGQGWESVRRTLAGLGLDPGALDPTRGSLRVDAEPLAGKSARPLALLVDPPDDVRLSLKPAGGLDEQRALLHESARALGGTLSRAAHWELSALGEGSGAEGCAWLLESLSGDPVWLRAFTGLRGEPLDELVHTEAARRLLALRRAAALVLFEVRRREGPQTAEATAALYRALLQRALRAQHSEADGARWALESDGWLRSAIALRAGLLGAALADKLERDAQAAPASAPASASATAPEPAPWWQGAEAASLLGRLWQQGRSLGADEAAAEAGVPQGPAPLVQLIERRLAYRAPEAPPEAPKPDYKFMQGDRGPRRKAKKKK